MRKPPSLRRRLEPLRGLWFCSGALCGWAGIAVSRPFGWIAAAVAGIALVLLARGKAARFLVVAGFAAQQIASWSWAPAVARPAREGAVAVVVESRVAPGRCRGRILSGPDPAWNSARVRTEFGRPGDTLRGIASLLPPRRATVPGGFDEREWMASAGLDGRLRWRGDSVRIGKGSEPLSERVAEAVRREVRLTLHRRLDPGSAALWTATQLAENGEIPTPALEAFKASGLFHMLSVGGFHMVVLGGGLVGLLSLLRVPRRFAWVGAAALVCAYAWVLGAPPSVARAAGAFGAGALAMAWGRRPHAGNSLFLVLGILVVVDPNAPFRMGAQLTFAATAALLWLSPALREMLVPRRVRGGHLDDWILSPLLASIAATLATGPILAWNTGVVPWVGILADLAGAILFSTGFLASMAVSALFWLPDGLVSGFSGAAELCARLVWEITLRCGNWSPGSWTPGRPDVVALIAWYAGILLLSVARRRELRGRAVAALCAIAVAAWAWSAFPRGARRMEVLVLDVGQGSAALVRWPSGRVWLLDAGPRSFSDPSRNAGSEAILPALRRWGVRGIDAVSVSHADLDHWGGLPWLSARIPPSTLLLPADSGTPGSAGFDSAVSSLLARGWKVHRLLAGRILSYGDGARAELVSPGGSGPRPRNQICLAWRLRIDSTAILVPGDADSVAESSQLASGLPLRSQVLVAGHHGSKHSSSLAWLRRVRPAVAILSYGAGNRYGHPNREVLERLDSAGARTLATPDGSVLCVLDGARVSCGSPMGDGIWRTAWSRGAWKPPWKLRS